MKVEISNMDNGSGMNTKLFIKSDYNPQNKIFNKNFGIIEEDDFIECFPIKNQNRVIENMSEGKKEGSDFFSTHPSSTNRISDIQKVIAKLPKS